MSEADDRAWCASHGVKFYGYDDLGQDYLGERYKSMTRIIPPDEMREKCKISEQIRQMQAEFLRRGIDPNELA